MRILNEILYSLFLKILSRKGTTEIGLRDIKDVMNFYNIEEEKLPEETFISQRHFQQGIRNVCNDCKCVMRREAESYTHLMIESLIYTLIKNANMISKVGKRNKASAKDIMLAFRLGFF